MNQSFNEWLQSRDQQLYNELNAGDVWKGVKGTARTLKKGWQGAGKVVGKRARNIAAGTALGLGALGYGLSGGDPNIDMVARHNNMKPAQVEKLKQEDPDHFKHLVLLANTDSKIHDFGKTIDSVTGKKTRVEPEDGYNWQAPATHHQSPHYRPSEPVVRKQSPKVKTSQDVIDDIDSVIGKR